MTHFGSVTTYDRAAVGVLRSDRCQRTLTTIMPGRILRPVLLCRAVITVLASLWITAAVPWPTALEHTGHHSHVVSLTWSHGQLHVVRRHHDVRPSVNKEGPPHIAAQPVHATHHADHVTHMVPATPALLPNISRPIVGMLATRAWASIALAPLPPPRWFPPPPEHSQAVALLRTTILVV